MIDIIYYIGVMCVEYAQELYKGSEAVVSWLNDVADPHHAHTYIFPAVAMWDSVFAAQYLLVMAGGEWFNVILKWLLAEHRPYWWVRETDFYETGPRPELLQTHQTCETGPGSPSGHVMSAASHVVLLSMWAMHIVSDRKLRINSWVWWFTWWLMALLLVQVGFARMVVATHFPHQVLLGAIMGFLVTPLLTLMVSDPYIWRRGRRQRWHVAGACGCIAIGFAVYWAMKFVGVDPQWTVQLAFKWCQQPENIHLNTTPLFSLVASCGSLLSWALFATPSVTRYRHNTKARSLLISGVSVACIHHLAEVWQQSIPTENATYFYLHQFFYSLVQGGIYLRVVPLLSNIPWMVSSRKKKN